MCNKGVIRCHKDVGLVNDVFNQKILDGMQGNMAIGHVRYSTTGQPSRENAQPLAITHVKGNLAVAHNGNLVNAPELRRQMEMGGGIFRSTSDTEALVYAIVRKRPDYSVHRGGGRRGHEGDHRRILHRRHVSPQAHRSP